MPRWPTSSRRTEPPCSSTSVPSAPAGVISPKRTRPPTESFSLRFDLDDGTSSEGWFSSRSQAASATPEIRTPVLSTTTADANPVASCVPFRSPEYLPFERRTLSVDVTRDGADVVPWNVWMQNYGELGTVKLGDHPAAALSTRLVPGDYWLDVTCAELRKFGHVTLSARRQLGRAVHVVP